MQIVWGIFFLVGALNVIIYKLHDPLWTSVLDCFGTTQEFVIHWLDLFPFSQCTILSFEILKLLSWRESPVSFLSDFFELKGCTFPVILPMSSFHVEPSLFEVDDRRIIWFSATSLHRWFHNAIMWVFLFTCCMQLDFWCQPFSVFWAKFAMSFHVMFVTVVWFQLGTLRIPR